MCLSTAYLGKAAGQEPPVAQDVTEIQSENGMVRLTDISGQVVEVSGRLTRIDLIRNVILIDPEPPAV
jgi:predicted RNA-binding protein